MGRVRLADGRRQTVYGRDRADVASRLRMAIDLEGRGLPQPAGRETVEGYLAAWLESSRRRVRPSTWETYERYLRRHALRDLGHLKLAGLRAAHLDRLYQRLLGEGLSPSTVHHLHAILHKALDQAVRWDLVGRNPADLVDPPTMARRTMRALSTDEGRRLLEVVRDERLEAVWVLALTTGMRRGELLALRWRDVDLDDASLSVTGTLQRVEGQLTICEPKTPSSRRSVELTALAVEALRKRRLRQREERVVAGPAWRDEYGLVFTTEIGTPVEAANFIRRSYWPSLERAGLRGLRFHDLRHTAATLMLGRGVHPKVASEMLGHSTVAITLNLYSHVTKTMGREAARAMQEVLG